MRIPGIDRIICFHHNDHDGRGAAAVVEHFFKCNNYYDPIFVEVEYNKNLPNPALVKKKDLVFIVDYSFSEDTIHILNEIREITNNVVWIDHHTSSLKLIEKYPELNEVEGLVVDGISAAALTFMYLYNIPYQLIPIFLKYISDYDCWKFKYGDTTNNFKSGLDRYDTNPKSDIWKKLFSEQSPDAPTMTKILRDGEIINEFIKEDYKFYRDNFAYESEIDGHKCIVINRKTNSWIFGDLIDKYPISVVWVFDGTKYIYSLFSSNNEIDCSAIAEKYGGGGSKRAAGFTSTELILKEIPSQ